MDGLKFKTTLYLTPVPDKALDVGVSPEIFRQSQIITLLSLQKSQKSHGHFVILRDSTHQGALVASQLLRLQPGGRRPGVLDLGAGGARHGELQRCGGHGGAASAAGAKCAEGRPAGAQWPGEVQVEQRGEIEG